MAPTEETPEAVAWLEQLEGYIERHGLCGYDPFDVKAHPLLQAVQPYAPLRKLSSGLLDVFPTLSRRMLRVKPTLNPKAFALVALGRLRRYQCTGEEQHLGRALDSLSWLRENAASGYSGLCWGYPFDVRGKDLHRPAGTPVGVVSATAGEAFSLAWRITGEETHRDAVCAIATFFLEDIHRVDCGGGACCFSYTTVDRWCVHNANLHAVAHLYRASDITGDAAYREAARPALRFTLDAQRRDGAWPYGAWSADEGYERAPLEMVDHHHTGFVLRSLQAIHAIEPTDGVKEAILKGYDFYLKCLFTPEGAPRITTDHTYPINIHACAEGVLCPAMLDDMVDGGLDVAARTLRWTREHMADGRTGLPYYRAYPWFANKLLCTRWGLAWIYYALAEYVYRRG
ncbi:MAG TPA: hypothetical protein ENN80_13650 [Candidatus Hydrogenedentes bacterium]|nr:hypothetical protein [Candidatus Hydrogenedentota bacterium]